MNSNIFIYDGSFDGLLSVVFDTFELKIEPDELLAEGQPMPMFADCLHNVVSDTSHAERVWRAVCKKLSPEQRGMVEYAWLSNEPQRDWLLFRFIVGLFKSEAGLDLRDEITLRLKRIATSVGFEKHRVIEFTRFQKVADGSYFAPIAPDHNVLPLALNYFRDRFADQRWIVYDLRRHYGYLYDLENVTEISFEEDTRLANLSEELLSEDETIFQRAWHDYFEHLAIKERINPKLQRQHLPVRFRRFMPEFNSFKI